jgi:hypothetical protein
MIPVKGPPGVRVGMANGKVLWIIRHKRDKLEWMGMQSNVLKLGGIKSQSGLMEECAWLPKPEINIDP